MQRLSILHQTRYSYDRPVSFTPHRLLLRPRDSHALRLIDASLKLSPPGDVRWRYDALGNCVCEFTPRGSADQLSIISAMTVERYPAYVEQSVDDPHSALPVAYSAADRALLVPLIQPVTEDAHGALASFVRDLIGDAREPALAFIRRLNSAIHQSFSYVVRDAEGVQSPAETLSLRCGSCRDFAWLMVEALRLRGLAARFVTGYLYSADAEIRGAGATHAWCEIFLPGLGWTEFDPTNNLVESADLIPIAVARTPAEASPICGGLVGEPGGCRMDVKVEVHLVGDEGARQAA